MSNDAKAFIGVLFLLGLVCFSVGLWLLVGTAWCLLVFGALCMAAAMVGVWMSD